MRWMVYVFLLKEILTEVIRREKQAGIIPEPDIDTYMKVRNIYIYK